jgi:hypothetical protein
MEYSKLDYNKYSINKCHYRYIKNNPFSANDDIMKHLIEIEKNVKEITKNNDIYMNLLIRIASMLMIEKYKIWEKHVNNMIRDYNNIELMQMIKNERLFNHEYISKEILIIIDKDLTCKFYIS